MTSPRPTRAEQDLASLRVMRSAKMSAASIAAMLGRSLKWTEARIAELEAAQTRAREPGAPVPEVSAPVSPAPQSPAPCILKGGPSGAASKPGQREFTAVVGERPAQAGHASGGHDQEARLSLSSEDGARRRRSGPKPPERPQAAGVERLKPLTPTALRWARQFAAAHWPVATIAWLFDLDAEQLGEALEAA